MWTWISGSKTNGAYGNYSGGMGGIGTPGARQGASSWFDGTYLWLFGGLGYNATTLCRLNDLWQFNGTTWTWVNGSSSANAAGIYLNGIGGTGAPGARQGAVSWYNGANLWLFGGNGYDATGTLGDLNDLWVFNGTTWTWVSGSSSANVTGNYTNGIGGIGAPGARENAVSWFDGTNLWLFGGNGYDATGTQGDLNDLWKFNGTNWIWVSGSSGVNAAGNYTNGIGGTGTPGARENAISWSDGTTLWLFGGNGYNATSSGYLNDLWKFNGAGWIWVSGSNSVNAAGNYTNGIGGTGTPGARGNAVSWFDGTNLWLFGGLGYNATSSGYLNDLWKFNGTNWIWVSGSSSANAAGNYGIQGTTATSNMPGARFSAVSWFDSTNLWLFGGYGCDSTGTLGDLNDLWVYQP